MGNLIIFNDIIVIWKKITILIFIIYYVLIQNKLFLENLNFILSSILLINLRNKMFKIFK